MRALVLLALAALLFANAFGTDHPLLVVVDVLLGAVTFVAGAAAANGELFEGA